MCSDKIFAISIGDGATEALMILCNIFFGLAPLIMEIYSDGKVFGTALSKPISMVDGVRDDDDDGMN